MFARTIKATKAAITTFRRSFEVAGGSGRWPQSAMLWSPVNESLAASKVARKRVAYLVENSPLASSLVQTFITAAVGDGPTARSNIEDPDERADIERRWNSFAAGCDIEGICDLGGFLSRLVRGVMIDGEAFAHFAIDNDELRLRFLAADQIDPSRTIVGNMTSGIAPRIVAGI
jgi:Phage portal protein, lambda family